MMAVPFESIRKEFNRLKDFVLNDLRRLVSEDIGGNYLAVSLITCACDAVSRFHYGKRNEGELFFTEYILPSDWKPMGRTIYDALRNGLIHSYETKDIIYNGKTIVLCISWGKKRHLSFSADSNTFTIFLNVKTLKTDLRKAFSLYERRLQRDPDLREMFHRMMKKDRHQ